MATVQPPSDMCGGVVAYDFTISEEKFNVKLSKSRPIAKNCVVAVSHLYLTVWQLYTFENLTLYDRRKYEARDL